tara:strand:+ start:3697 stop:4146 length:450 start_codon:yes stop_codon:yes gene_type:complete
MSLLSTDIVSENIESVKLILSIPQVQRLKLRLLEKQDGYLVLEMPFNSELESIPGSGLVAHGAIMTVLDTALGVAVCDQFKFTRSIATLDLRVDYFEKPKAFSSIIVKTRCLKVTNQIVFVQGDVYCKDWPSPVAHGVATFSHSELPCQ